MTFGIALGAGLLATAGTAVAGTAGADPAITVKGLIGHSGACASAKPKLVGVQENNVVAIAMPPMAVRVGQVDSGEPVASGSATCSLNFRVVAPAGYTAELKQARFVGAATLAEGATASSEVNYLLPGFAGKYVTTTKPFTGPSADPWTYTDELPAASGKAQGQSVSLDVVLAAKAGPNSAAGSIQWTTEADGATMHLAFALKAR
ncbi:hypothetical protein GCM10010123_21460 [Pilimelia anulata]|uniref:DUF4360 domain-containing protein n=1 Tax=Pilimelia anulata TaxID=53371 RepID=A0A8J3B2S5_9ACTN|nr:DUF4360 domain-containing protein [Pilimelia anulata]GGJ91351.1 hypothetical protein GCM10010123_21460 [Pilimelia anulata]